MKKFSYVLIILFIFIIICLLGDMFISNNSNNGNINKDCNIDFKDYSNLLSKRNIHSYIDTSSDISAVDSIYLDNGNVYFKFADIDKLTYLDDSIKKKITSLKYEEVDFIFDSMGKGISLYKLPLKNIILMDSYKYSSDGSSIILFENSNGDVYYFSNSQNGNIKYSLFNSIGEVNVKKSNLNNIVSFGNYIKNDNINIYGIDINGNTLNFSFE